MAAQKLKGFVKPCIVRLLFQLCRLIQPDRLCERFVACDFYNAPPTISTYEERTLSFAGDINVLSTASGKSPSAPIRV